MNILYHNWSCVIIIINDSTNTNTKMTTTSTYIQVRRNYYATLAFFLFPTIS